MDTFLIKLSEFNPTKSQFGVPSLNFLGHIVDKSGIRPMEDKVHAIRDFPVISSVRKLREFLGLVKYRKWLYCQSLIGYSIARVYFKRTVYLCDAVRTLSEPFIIFVEEI